MPTGSEEKCSTCGRDASVCARESFEAIEPIISSFGTSLLPGGSLGGSLPMVILEITGPRRRRRFSGPRDFMDGGSRFDFMLNSLTENLRGLTQLVSLDRPNFAKRQLEQIMVLAAKKCEMKLRAGPDGAWFAPAIDHLPVIDQFIEMVKAISAKVKQMQLERFDGSTELRETVLAAADVHVQFLEELKTYYQQVHDRTHHDATSATEEAVRVSARKKQHEMLLALENAQVSKADSLLDAAMQRDVSLTTEESRIRLREILGRSVTELEDLQSPSGRSMRKVDDDDDSVVIDIDEYMLAIKRAIRWVDARTSVTATPPVVERVD